MNIKIIAGLTILAVFAVLIYINQKKQPKKEADNPNKMIFTENY